MSYGHESHVTTESFTTRTAAVNHLADVIRSSVILDELTVSQTTLDSEIQEVILLLSRKERTTALSLLVRRM